MRRDRVNEREEEGEKKAEVGGEDTETSGKVF